MQCYLAVHFGYAIRIIHKDYYILSVKQKYRLILTHRRSALAQFFSGEPPKTFYMSPKCSLTTYSFGTTDIFMYSYPVFSYHFL
jgi:hypothetical protein